MSTGECVESMVLAVLLGKHTLYRVKDLLAPYDLRAAFGYTVAAPRYFNDERLGKALDDLFDKAGVSQLNARAVLAAIRAYDVSLAHLHLDMTTVSVHGEYENSTPPVDPDSPRAIPHVTRGHSKARRPDLKQVVYGLAVAGDGAVPVFGRVASGNRPDSYEFRFMLDRLRESLPDPRSVLYVGDSKLFSAETLVSLSAAELHYVTLLPRSVGLWKQVYELFRADATPAPVLKVKNLGKGKEPHYHYWRGRSYDLPYEFEHDGSDYSIPLRLVVVESDALKARKKGTVERRRLKEQLALEKLRKTQQKEAYECAGDAQRTLERLKKRSFTFHKVELDLASFQQRQKRSRPGRPRKGEQPKYETRWRIAVEFSADAEAFERVFREETCFVVVSDVKAGDDRLAADRATLAAYDDQHYVESSFHWTKGPLAVAPIFLKTPKRIAALGLVYVLALMTYALIQRDARARLQAAGTTMPGNRGWTDKPTTEVVWRLFEGLDTVQTDDPEETIYITGLNTEQVRVFDLLGVDLHAHPRVRLAPPREPRPGERSFKPRPRAKKGKN